MPGTPKSRDPSTIDHGLPGLCFYCVKDAETRHFIVEHLGVTHDAHVCSACIEAVRAIFDDPNDQWLIEYVEGIQPGVVTWLRELGDQAFDS